MTETTMREENKLQIKIKSQTESRMMEDLDAEMIIEWDIKKIVISLCSLLLLMGSFIYYYFFVTEHSVVVKKQMIATKSQPPMIQEKVIFKTLIKTPIKKSKKELVTLTPNFIKNSQHIKRGLLAKKTIKKEPIGTVNTPVIVNTEKAISLTYFTEVINMQGNIIYHVWIMNNKVIYKKKINILGNRWRISTRKLLTYAEVGQWQVRVVTDKGDILHKINFLVQE
jgi:hypothetical protein